MSDNKHIFRVKDPDAMTAFDDEAKRDAFLDEYSECGEYFQIELDTSTMNIRFLPRKEWPRR